MKRRAVLLLSLAAILLLAPAADAAVRVRVRVPGAAVVVGGRRVLVPAGHRAFVLSGGPVVFVPTNQLLQPGFPVFTPGGDLTIVADDGRLRVFRAGNVVTIRDRRGRLVQRVVLP
jgi:hypothetical protein